MKMIKMQMACSITFKELCNKYLINCRERNLREGTINHYRQSYLNFFKFFDPNMPISNIDEAAYKGYVLYLKSNIKNDVSINSYLRDFITTIHFAQHEGYVADFKMQSIKVDRKPIETYTEDELQKLLRKPDMKHCSFSEYQAWVMTNFLFSTAVRQRSLMHIRIKDLDFDNRVVYVNVTKNRKPLIVPINQTLTNILIEYLKYRQHKNDEDYLFCNIFGQQYAKATCYPSDTAYLMLSLMNESFYSVDSITIQPYAEEGEYNTYMAIGDPITVQDPTILANGDYLIAVSPTTFGNIGYNITLTYKSLDDTETASSSASTKKVYRVISDEIKDISTPDDLLNMNEGYHYKQTADIDLDGIGWTGAEFNGVFNGCGHSITNMTRVGTVSGNIGLFTSGHGIIKNVNLKKVTFIVDGSSNAGALLGTGRITIDNCHVDSDSVIIATGNVGGIVGYLDLGGSSVTNCTNSAAVSGGSSVGGIAGVGDGDIINCTNYGNISSNERAGGISGSVSATGYVIENCENYGKINGNADVDGILADSFE